MNFSQKNHVFTVVRQSMSASNFGPMMQKYAKYPRELEKAMLAARRSST